LQIIKDKLGENHLESAAVLNNLGLLLSKKKKSEDAIKYYLIALNVF
jgi:hypothetical protein